MSGVVPVPFIDGSPLCQAEHKHPTASISALVVAHVGRCLGAVPNGTSGHQFCAGQ